MWIFGDLQDNHFSQRKFECGTQSRCVLIHTTVPSRACPRPWIAKISPPVFAKLNTQPRVRIECNKPLNQHSLCGKSTDGLTRPQEKNSNFRSNFYAIKIVEIRNKMYSKVMWSCFAISIFYDNLRSLGFAFILHAHMLIIFRSC